MRAWLAIGVVLMTLMGAGRAAQGQDSPKDYGAWFLRTYGPADIRVTSSADAVFRRVLAVADQKSGRIPRLLVVNKHDGLAAEALPDGTIVINPALVRFCFAGARNEAEGQARLAFVLGHEMAHLAYDDAWHAGAFAMIRRHPDSEFAELSSTSLKETAADKRTKEMRADQAGFMFMLMAGYPPEGVIGPRTDFLVEWARQTAGAGAPDEQHPSFKERSGVLRARLKDVEAAMPFHHFGIRLLQLGRYEDAVRMLERFRREIPSREADANLGLAYLERALARQLECGIRDGLRYRLLTSVDPESVATRIHLRGSGSALCRAPADEDLDSAVGILREAYSREQSYMPARLNLAAALVIRGQDRDDLDAYAVATGGVDLSAQPDALDPRLVNVAAVALHRAHNSMPWFDTSDAALSWLQKVDADVPATEGLLRAAIAYNSARVRQDRGRTAAAREGWRAFLAIEGTGPYADEARHSLGEALSPAQRPRSVGSRETLQMRVATSVRRLMQNTVRQDFNLGDLQGTFLIANDVWGLELSGALELVDERLRPPLAHTAVPSAQGARAVFDTGGGRQTVVFDDVAYDLDGGLVVRRVLFEPR